MTSSLLALRTPIWVLPIALVSGWIAHDRIIYRPHLAADMKVALKASEKNRIREEKATTIATTVRDLHDTQQEQVHAVTEQTIRAIPLYLPAKQHVLSGGVCPVAARSGVPGDGQAGEADHRGVPDAVPDDGSLPLGFVRLHDYAALGVAPPVPAPSGEPLDSPSGVGLPELAGTIAHNYGVSLGYKAEVMAWRGWYVKERDAWEAGRK